MSDGKVLLVGAGPGDPGLLTRKGADALAWADVVVYDRLISDELLELAPQAEKVYVGKTQGNHPVPQGKINDILLKYAKDGKNVVRLKGGDPYIFGRGAEEAGHLAAHGVSFEVVHGVTSAVAALGYAGIPATARDAASSVHIITGHAREGGELDIRYDALAQLGGTLVFLMGVSTMGQIREGLLAAGMPAATPAAMVQEGTTPRQRRLLSTLGSVADDAAEAGIASPAILVVGKVCSKAPQLGWFDALPLKGKSIVVTRPRARCRALAGKLERLGAEVLCMPSIETRPLPTGPAREALGHIGEYSWLVLTSAQGVTCLFAALDEMGLDARALAGAQVAAIGPGTAAELSAHGLKADLVPGRYDSAQLAQALAQRCEPGGKVLMLRAQVGAHDVPEALRAAGVECDDVATYETVALDARDSVAAQRVRAGSVDFVTFTSASTVRGFEISTLGAAMDTFTAACIGRCTQAAAAKRGMATITAREATIDSLVEAIVQEASHE